jgi:hypothetical protein
MALIITGIFIQFLCLAVQVIQLRLGRPADPAPQCPVPAAGWTAPGQAAEARLPQRTQVNQMMNTPGKRAPKHLRLVMAKPHKHALSSNAKNPQTTDRSSPAVPRVKPGAPPATSGTQHFAPTHPERTSGS